jgi:ubiquinone/menaquinone biosynthesis C-methylase UbiE
MDENLYQAVIAANQKVHSVLATSYNTNEPHFRAENIAHVESLLLPVFAETQAKRMLDLGCGTGFLLQIGKKHVPLLDGVDVTQAMLDQVDRSGEAEIRLHLHDTGSFPAQAGAYDVVTAYSFLHHLYDIAPTLKTAARALRPGGQFYADLDPNFYFWEAIQNLDPAQTFSPIIERERASVMEKDSEIEAKFQVDKDTFNHAEYNKNITGGFREEQLQQALLDAGFSSVRFFYYWFVGQASMINAPGIDRAQGVASAAACAQVLQQGLPLTRHLFKYLGFIATR